MERTARGTEAAMGDDTGEAVCAASRAAIGEREMIYAFIQRDPFPRLIGMRILHPKNGNLSAVPFLHPDQVDAASKGAMTPMTRGYPVDPAEVPKAVLWESKDKPLPDVTMLHGVNIVSERVKEIIERFEPGVHQFLPVDLYRPEQDKPFAHGYWLVVCQRINGVDATHTTHSLRGPIWFPVPGGKFVFSRAALGNAQLWVDPSTSYYTFCSDELGKALKKAGVIGLELKAYDQI